MEALVDPVAKFMQEGNDPVKNDADMLIAPATMQGLVEMGKFIVMALYLFVKL